MKKRPDETQRAFEARCRGEVLYKGRYLSRAEIAAKVAGSPEWRGCSVRQETYHGFGPLQGCDVWVLELGNAWAVIRIDSRPSR